METSTGRPSELAPPRGRGSIACLLFVVALGGAFWAGALWAAQPWVH